MKTPQKSKLYAFTLKAGTKRTESITAQKRHLVSLILSVKKTKKAVIFYNQKKNISALEKHLIKSDVKTLWLDKTTKKADYDKLAQDFSQKNYSVILCPDACIEALKIIQKEIKLAIHFDFPKNAASYHMRNEFMLGESYFLASDEDKETIEKLTQKEDISMRLGRLRGHRNASVDIPFFNHKEEEKTEEKTPVKEETKKASDTAQSDTPKKETSKERKKSSKPKNKKEASAQKEVLESPKTTESLQIEASKTGADEPSKRRSRRKKDDTENGERLPAKRSRPRRSAIVTEASAPLTKETKEAPAQAKVKEEKEPENDGGIYLDIEVRQAPKPKIRRNPQGRVIGMGEHTPNFMLKEIIFKNSTLHEEDE